MNRKVIKHGRSTLTVSLPFKWAKKNGVKQGDEVLVEEKGTDLIIRQGKPNDFDFNLDIKSNERSGLSYITSSYRAGVDNLMLTFDDVNYSKKVQSIIVKELKGYEIVQQLDHGVTVKNILTIDESDFNLVFKRLWAVCLEMSRKCHLFAKGEGGLVTNDFLDIDNTVNRFANHCMRIMQKKATKKNSILLYHLIKCLEELADEYKAIVFLGVKKCDLKLGGVFLSLNKNLHRLNELYYDFDIDKAEKIFSSTKNTKKDICLCFDSENALVFSYLLKICNKIRSMVSTIIEINITESI